MNICIEGPDNSGKTTLVDQLSYIYDREIRHAGKPESNDFAAAEFEDECADSGKFILDRSQAVSGLIYDVVVRKQMPYFGMHDVERLAYDALLIICLPPKELVLGDKIRGQMPGVRENHAALYDAYDSLVKDGKIGQSSVFVYDYTMHSVTDIVDWIERMLGGDLY